MTRPAADRLDAVLVEAFTDQACCGNGAAVVRLEEAVSDAWMQHLAGSLKQSETAFLLPHSEGWLLRWFTPSCEVPLCGHATLAALIALQHWRRLGPSGSTTFHTRSGPLPVRLREALGQLTLPSAPLVAQPVPAGLATLLAERLHCVSEGFWRSSLGYCVVLLPAEAALASLENIAAQLEGPEAQGLVLMQPMPTGASAAVAGCPADYQLRFFAPGLGIDEDPVTGSAHALVAPYWLERLGLVRVVGWQCSPRPGGMVCEPASSGMIRLSGTGVLLWSGHLHLQPGACSGAAERWRQQCGIV